MKLKRISSENSRSSPHIRSGNSVSLRTMMICRPIIRMEPFDNECSKSCDQENRNQVVITVPIIENPPVRAKYAEVQNSQKSDGDNDVAEPNQYTDDEDTLTDDDETALLLLDTSASSVSLSLFADVPLSPPQATRAMVRASAKIHKRSFDFEPTVLRSG